MDCYYWIALKSVSQVGNVTFRRLLERFGSPENVLRASASEIASVRGVGPTVVEAIRSGEWRKAADRECAAIERGKTKVVPLLSEEYPVLLKEIADAPPYLYVKGDLRALERGVAVVGSRRASGYGLLATERISHDLAVNGIPVVSGMARGIDTAAHRGALKAGGYTVGVLGCGIDVVYPPENRKLFMEMTENGALVSEFPMEAPPLAENFPRRNRIISGMCKGVLVVEAAENSGSLITAQLALEQGRDVFAIPGNINLRSSRGTNGLIKQGAKLVEGVEDILEEVLPPVSPKKGSPAPMNLSDEEMVLYRFLTEGPLHIDEIIAKSALTVGDVSAILLRLELKGAVSQLPGKFFAVA